MTDNDIKLDLNFIRNKDVRMVAERLLFELGFQNRLIGTDYLAQAIALKYFDEKLHCTDIYTQVAKNYSTTPGSVERAIRHTIKNCRAEGGIKDFNEISGCNVVDRKYETTSSEFISIVSKWLHWVRSKDEQR